MFRTLRSRFLLLGATLVAASLLFFIQQPLGIVLSALAFLAAILLARSVMTALTDVTDVARKIGGGDWSARTRAIEPREMNELGRALNQIAERWEHSRQEWETTLERDQAALRHLTDGVILLDAQMNVIQLNPAAEAILAIHAQDVIDKSFTLAARDHELVACLREAQSSGQETARVVEQIGARRFLRIIATPIRSTDATTYLVVLQDLTQIRRLETVRRDFISNISHELRTPLAGLQALVETLQSGALEDRNAATLFLARIGDEVERLNRLVDELLELAALESSRAPLECTRVDLAALVQRAVERLQPQADRAGVRLAVAPSEILHVNAAAARIEQVLLNLIHNAIKFTPAGGSIECRVHTDERDVIISVHDTGIGIAPQDLPRIFERFYKVDRGRASGGTGLGLAIAKHIVELHGGKIWAESMEGSGTDVFFTLPR